MHHIMNESHKYGITYFNPSLPSFGYICVIRLSFTYLRLLKNPFNRRRRAFILQFRDYARALTFPVWSAETQLALVFFCS